MKGIKKLIAAAVCGILSLTAALGLAACSDNKKGDDGADNRDPQIVAIYELYKQAAGNNAMSYEQWLLSIKGEKGDKGDKGERGNKIFRAAGDPTEELEAIEGDMYVDTESWNVWFYEDGEWVNAGSLTGEVGAGGEQDDDKNVVKDFGTITIQAGETYDLSFEDVEDGTYYLYAKVTDGEVVSGGLTATTAFLANGKPIGNPLTYDMYSLLSNTYKSVHIIDSSNTKWATTTVLHNNTETEMELKVALKEYVAPEIVVGEEIEVPFFNTNAGYIPVAIPSMAGGTYNITITNWNSTGAPSVNETSGDVIAINFTNNDGTYTQTGVALTSVSEVVCFVDGQSRHAHNATVKFERI